MTIRWATRAGTAAPDRPMLDLYRPVRTPCSSHEVSADDRTAPHACGRDPRRALHTSGLARTAERRWSGHETESRPLRVRWVAPATEVHGSPASMDSADWAAQAPDRCTSPRFTRRRPETGESGCPAPPPPFHGVVHGRAASDPSDAVHDECDGCAVVSRRLVRDLERREPAGDDGACVLSSTPQTGGSTPDTSSRSPDARRTVSKSGHSGRAPDR